MRRLVEAVESLYLLDLCRVDALPAALAGADSTHRAPAGLAACPVATLQLRHHLLDRAARDELDHDERDKQDAEERWDHEEQPLEDVRPHGLLLPPPSGNDPVVRRVVGGH